MRRRVIVTSLSPKRGEGRGEGQAQNAETISAGSTSPRGCGGPSGVPAAIQPTSVSPSRQCAATIAGSAARVPYTILPA